MRSLLSEGLWEFFISLYNELRKSNGDGHHNCDYLCKGDDYSICGHVFGWLNRQTAWQEKLSNVNWGRRDGRRVHRKDVTFSHASSAGRGWWATPLETLRSRPNLGSGTTSVTSSLADNPWTLIFTRDFPRSDCALLTHIWEVLRLNILRENPIRDEEKMTYMET